MARKRCAGCGQFAADSHPCPARNRTAPSVPTAPPTAFTLNASDPSKPFSRIQSIAEKLPRQQVQETRVEVPTVSIPPIKNPEALAVQLEQAMSPASTDSDLRTRNALRQIFEQRFGAIDWQDQVSLA